MKSGNNRRQRHLAISPEAPPSGERGFTLIETVIALVVMMVVSLATISLFFYATNYNTGANERAIAIAIAQEQIEKLRSVAYSDATLTDGTTGSGSLAALANVVRAGRTYSIVRTVSTANSLKTITITVTPQGAGSVWSRSAVTVMTQRAPLTTGAYMGA